MLPYLVSSLMIFELHKSNRDLFNRQLDYEPVKNAKQTKINYN